MDISLGFLRNGITSAFTCLMSADPNLCSRSFTNSSCDFSQPLNSFVLSCRCLKFRGILFRIYHSKSYQSRPFTLFFQARYTKACIFPAKRVGKVKQRVMNDWGSRSNFCSVLNFNGGWVSTSIFILTVSHNNVKPSALTHKMEHKDDWQQVLWIEQHETHLGLPHKAPS